MAPTSLKNPYYNYSYDNNDQEKYEHKLVTKN